MINIQRLPLWSFPFVSYNIFYVCNHLALMLGTFIKTKIKVLQALQKKKKERYYEYLIMNDFFDKVLAF